MHIRPLAESTDSERVSMKNLPGVAIEKPGQLSRETSSKVKGYKIAKKPEDEVREVDGLPPVLLKKTHLLLFTQIRVGQEKKVGFSITRIRVLI